MAEISDALRSRITERARGLCEYCLSPESVGIDMDVDHIIPRSADGSDDLSNFCLACPSCNKHKGAKQTAADPETGQVVRLFNPRVQNWNEHFQWDQTGTIIFGITPTGRATVECLQMNRIKLVQQARPLWIFLGIHPPLKTE